LYEQTIANSGHDITSDYKYADCTSCVARNSLPEDYNASDMSGS